MINQYSQLPSDDYEVMNTEWPKSMEKMHMSKYWNVYERYLWKILILCLNMHM